MSFIAVYAGLCAKGCDGIKPGDTIEYTGPMTPYAHVGECPDDAEPLTGAVCPKCFLTTALAGGGCGCDE